MKRKELKRYTSSEIEEMDNALLEASEDGIIKMTRVYIASEADSVMDAMEHRIKELEAQLENVQNTMYTDNVDLGMENHKLKERIKELETEVIGYKASLERANFKMCEKDARIKNLECDKAYLENDKQVCAECLRLKKLEAENARMKSFCDRLVKDCKWLYTDRTPDKHGFETMVLCTNGNKRVAKFRMFDLRWYDVNNGDRLNVVKWLWQPKVAQTLDGTCRQVQGAKMSEEIISKQKLEERYKKIVIRTEETVNPFSGEKEKRTVVDLIHDGITYYVHIEFSPFGTTYSGDMGCFMFQPGYGVGTFKGTSINPCYWGEKIKAAGQEYYIRDFDMRNVDRAYKEEILQHYEYEWEEEYLEEAKKAWEMSDEDFKKWYETWRERDDEEDFAEEVKRVRDAGKPSDYNDRDSEESAYDAVETAAKKAGLDWDFETIGDIASNGKGDCYRFLYACCVLQLVANKIVNKEET